MKLKEFLEDLQAKVELDPTLLELDVVSSSDDEGNWYNKVYFPASIGHFNEGEFTNYCQFDDFQFNEADINAICVN